MPAGPEGGWKGAAAAAGGCKWQGPWRWTTCLFFAWLAQLAVRRAASVPASSSSPVVQQLLWPRRRLVLTQHTQRAAGVVRHRSGDVAAWERGRYLVGGSAAPPLESHHDFLYPGYAPGFLQ